MNSKNIKENRIEYGIGEDIIVDGGFMRVARSPNKLKLPQNPDNDLAYLTGYHLGDGYLEDAYKTFEREEKGGYEIIYADCDVKQLALINSVIKDKFGHMLRIYKRPNINLWIARTHSKVLHWYLNKKLEIPIGRRKNVKIPNWVHANKDFLSNFLSGFFDAEADINKTTNRILKDKKYYRIRIQLTQKDGNMLIKIKDILNKYFKIKSDVNKKWNQNAFILRIIARNAINIFGRDINFRNPTKRETLTELIKKIPYKQPRKINH